jgi:hypothetical protein
MTTLSTRKPTSAAALNKPRVLLVLNQYPQIGQTQIKNEIEALERDYEIMIAARRGPDVAYQDHRPYQLLDHREDLLALVNEFRPDILHTHSLHELSLVGQIADMTGIPFTARAYCSDTIALQANGWKGRITRIIKREPAIERSDWFAQAIRAIQSELCLGVLTLPCSRPWLLRAGVGPEKLINCFPAVRFDDFHDRSPNGDAVMSMGVASARKPVPDFFRLAAKVSGHQFNLYAMSHRIEPLKRKAATIRARVSFIEPIQPELMPAEYKKHRWLVYTGDLDSPAIGWPMAIAEAQAAGVGVCVPNLRPDLAEYVGDGAGVLYDSIDELPAIVSCPVPEEMRERGFEQARKSDIARHQHLLTDLWDTALGTGTPRRGAVTPIRPALKTAPLGVAGSLRRLQV